MEKKFENISYDLSQNLLSHEKDLVRLDHFALILTIGRFLKELDKPDIKELNLCFINKDLHEGTQFKTFTDIFAKTFTAKLSSLGLRIADCQIRFKIRFVLAELINFFKIAKVDLYEDSSPFIRNLVLTSQGTVNTMKTVLQVLDKEKLSSYKKFYLAAKFFQGDIKQYFQGLTDKEKKYLLNVNPDHDFALYYWNWKLTKKRTIIKNLQSWVLSGKDKLIAVTVDKPKRKEIFIHQHLFLKAVEEHNEMAVHYLWVNFISKLNVRMFLLKNILPKYMTMFTHANIIMYLIFETRKEELTDFFDDECSRIQILVYVNQRWRDVFLKVLNVLDKHICSHYSLDRYYDILSGIALYCHAIEDSSEIDLKFLDKFVKKIPKGEMDKFEDSDGVFFDLLRAPFERTDIYLVKNILDCCSKNNNLKFFKSHFGINLIKNSLKNSEYEFTKEILERFNENEVTEIKYKVFENKAFEIFSDQVFKGEKMMDNCIRWFSESISVEHMDEFLINLPFEKGGQIMKEVFIFDEKYMPLKKIEEMLFWLCEQEDVDFIKTKMAFHIEENETAESYTIKCYENIGGLVLRSKWDFLGVLLTWKRCTPEDKINLARKLLTDSYLFEEMLKKRDTLDYLYFFCEFICDKLSIPDNDNHLINFKLKVFSIKKLFRPLILRWDLGKIMYVILWFDPPPNKVLKFGEYILPILERRQPDMSKKTQSKFKTFTSWLESKYPKKATPRTEHRLKVEEYFRSLGL